MRGPIVGAWHTMTYRADNSSPQPDQYSATLHFLSDRSFFEDITSHIPAGSGVFDECSASSTHFERVWSVRTNGATLVLDINEIDAVKRSTRSRVAAARGPRSLVLVMNEHRAFQCSFPIYR
jgi:hypothetical protein